MTLYRQLIIFTFLLFFVLFAGTWVAKLESTRSFLVDQLASHAQDTATSLALSMSPLVAAEDLAGVETMMNAIFDRGYYKEIIFSDIQGEVVSNRLASLNIDGVPNWFIQVLPLRHPAALHWSWPVGNRPATSMLRAIPGMPTGACGAPSSESPDIFCSPAFTRSMCSWG